MIVYTPPHPARNIPVIDFAGGARPDARERERVAWEIHKACRDTGFFDVANHVVAEDLVAAQFAWTCRFFDLPAEEKMAIHMQRSATSAGYEPVGEQTLDSQDPDEEKAPPDLKESFYCGTELADDHPLARARHRSFGHNQWPASLPGFRDQMLAYRAAMCRLGDEVLALLALSLDLPENHFRPYYEPPGTTLRILRYPPQPASARANQLGAGAHTDWGGITLLAQDDLGGLEVRNAGDEWIKAKPVAGTFVVNLGDLMQRWTNGLYRSTMHRVKNLNPAGRNRHSVAFFYGPWREALIECLPTCTDAAHPPKYAPVTAGEHTREMFLRSYGYAPTSRPA
jgi:isopenicillin N synthase-like dioxygenase